MASSSRRSRRSLSESSQSTAVVTFLQQPNPLPAQLQQLPPPLSAVQTAPLQPLPPSVAPPQQPAPSVAPPQQPAPSVAPPQQPAPSAAPTQQPAPLAVFPQQPLASLGRQRNASLSVTQLQQIPSGLPQFPATQQALSQTSVSQASAWPVSTPVAGESRTQTGGVTPSGSLAVLQLSPPPQFPVFQSLSDAHTRWQKWLIQFNMYLSASGVTNDGQRRHLLLYIAGPELQSVVNAHLTQQSPDFDVLVRDITAYFRGKGNTAFARYEFRSITQRDGESLDAWVSRLHSKASECDFSLLTESMIRDQIIAGCTSDQLRRRLLQEGDTSLGSVLSIARATEKAALQSLEMRPKPSQSNEVAAISSQFGTGNAQSGTFRSRNSSQRRSELDNEANQMVSVTCYRCGRKGHKSCDVAKGKTCRRCGKIGHFAKACQSAGDVACVFREPVLPTSVPPETSQLQLDPDEVFAVSVNPTTCRTIVRLNGMSHRVLLDSGASVNIIAESVLPQIVRCPKLVPTSMRIFSYGAKEPLPLAGEILLNVEAGDKSGQAVFAVVKDGTGATLLGRATAQQMNLLHVGPSSATSQEEVCSLDSSVCEILSRYSSCFKGLGKIRNVSARIHMKPDVIPVAHPKTRVPVHLEDATSAELKRQLDLGIIEPVTDPSPWVARMVVVPKKTPGQVRLTQDFRGVNVQE